VIQFLLLLDREQTGGAWQREPVVTNGLRTFLIEALHHHANPPGGIAEHGRDFVWRVALLHQPQDMPMRSLDRIGCASIALMKLFCYEFGLDCHSKWIPLLANQKGVRLCLDLAPGPAGQVGQIIALDFDAGDICPPVVAKSWQALLSAFADDLEAGDYSLQENSLGQIFLSSLSHRLSASKACRHT